MLTILFLFALALGAYGAPTISPPDLSKSCSDMNWTCHDIETAKKCNKFSSCVQIWEDMHPPQDNNEICDICKDMVKQARDQLLSNETQEELKEVFEGSCNLLPIKPIAAECRKIVDEIVPELVDMLASRMDPNQVCTVAGLCNNGWLVQSFKDKATTVAPTNDESDCKNCKEGLKFVGKVLNIVPKDLFTDLLLRSCVINFHGTSSQCLQLVFKLLPSYDQLLKTNAKSLCAPENCLEDLKNNECQLCRNMIGTSKIHPKADTKDESLKAEAAITSLKLSIQNYCEQVQTDAAKTDRCKRMVLDEVMKQLWMEQKPKSVCVGRCESKPDPLKDSESCKLCTQMASALQNEARSPDVTSALINNLHNLCKKTGELQNVCQSFIDQYFDLIYDELVNDLLEPSFLCHLLRMCPQPAANVKVLKAVCHVCHIYSIVTPAIKDTLLLAIKESAETNLKKLCSTTFHMYDHESCEEFMKEVGPVIYNFLRVVSPDMFCGQMSVCPTVQAIVPGVGDNMTCEFCETLVEYLKNIISSPSTKEEFKTALDNFCGDLKEFSSQCKALVDEYYDQFYDFLVKNLDPAEVCGALGLCNGQLSLVKVVPATPIQTHPQVEVTPSENSFRKSIKAISLKKSRPPQSVMPGIKIQSALNVKENKYKKYMLDQNTHLDAESNSVNEIDTQQLPVERFLHPAPPKSFMNCEICKSVVSYLEHELKDPKEEDQIRQVLEEVCKVLPKEVQQQCQDFISTNIDFLISAILKEADPDTVCAFLKACPKVDANFIPCELCRKVMQYVEKELGENRTEEAIRSALDKACSYLPKKYAQECTEFVDKYTDMIIDLLVKEVAPTVVCAALGLCPLDNKVDGEVECQVCQYVLHYLQEQLMDNATEEEIKKAIDKVCAALPSTLADNCKAFVDEFGNSMLVLLAQKLDPSVVCVNFKLCPGKGIISHHSVASHTIKSLKLDTCSTCQMVVDYMDKLLENDDVDTEITKLIEKICNVIPVAAREQCASMIETYGPFVLQMIGQLSNSKEVCQAVDLCSRSVGHVQLLGGEKCSYGPSYWCQSPEHASACNAEPFCKKQVWKD